MSFVPPCQPTSSFTVLLLFHAFFTAAGAPSSFVTSGIAVVDAAGGTLTVSELPVGRWTQDFKQMLVGYVTGELMGDCVYLYALIDVCVCATVLRDGSVQACECALSKRLACVF